MQPRGGELHRLERARPKILDEYMGAGEESQQQRLPLGVAQIERHALLVAGIDLPMHADAVHAPIAQRIAFGRILDLHDFGPEVGELQAQHVAGYQPRQIEHPNAVEWTPPVGMKRSHSGSAPEFTGHHRRWQATNWPGLTSRSAGDSLRHRSTA